MLVALLTQWLTSSWPAVLAVLLILYLLNNKFKNGLHKYPGPALAAYTNWWRFFDVRAGRAEHTHINLHRQHGNIVRLGPNVLSFADPKAIKDIYGLNKGYTKTEFYPVQQNVSNGTPLPSLFSTTNESYHANFRRCINSAFTMSTLVSYEPLVDSTTRVFLSQTAKQFCQPDKSCDFARWLQFYAFDVIGDLSFSKRMGFIERGEDVDGIVDAIAENLAYAGQIGQQPWLDRYIIRKNPVKLWLMKHGFIASSNAIAAFTAARSNERSAVDDKAIARDEENGEGVDFLTRFKQSQKQHPEFMTDLRVHIATSSLVNAGSDTTAISLASIFYHLLRHRRAYSRLIAELDAAAANPAEYPSMSASASTAHDEHNNPLDRVISWADAQKLPYLDAVIQESFRLFPAVGLLLERHVPAGGAVICGERIPGGTIVGCNAWVLHRTKSVFGEDVDDFRPERWLLVDDEKQSEGTATPAQLKEMRATMFQFGGGARTCIGRNISLLEMYKLVPTFLRRFEITSEMGSGEWTTRNCWFVRQLGFEVRFKERSAS